jgi:hypothetical protein
VSVPTTQYQRFLAAMPEELREPCRSRFKDSGLSPDHAIFQILADIFEKRKASSASTETPATPASPAQPEDKAKIPDFLGEAQLHSQLAKQLLADFKEIPGAILAQIEPQLRGLLAALTDPVEKLGGTATDLQRQVEKMFMLLPKRPEPGSPPEEWWPKQFWRMRWLFQNAWWLATDRPTWIATGSIGIALTVIVLSLGASNLSHYYEQSYQKRLAHMEADSVENTIAFNRLLTAGIALKVERNKEGDGYFLVLQGAHKAAQPVNSPEGLAVEVWP